MHLPRTTASRRSRDGVIIASPSATVVTVGTLGSAQIHGATVFSNGVTARVRQLGLFWVGSACSDRARFDVAFEGATGDQGGC